MGKQLMFRFQPMSQKPPAPTATLEERFGHLPPGERRLMETVVLEQSALKRTLKRIVAGNADCPPAMQARAAELLRTWDTLDTKGQATAFNALHLSGKLHRIEAGPELVAIHKVRNAAKKAAREALERLAEM